MELVGSNSYYLAIAAYLPGICLEVGERSHGRRGLGSFIGNHPIPIPHTIIDIVDIEYQNVHHTHHSYRSDSCESGSV